MTKAANLLKYIDKINMVMIMLNLLLFLILLHKVIANECALHSLFYIKCRLEGIPYQFSEKYCTI